jgi:hypothetical protein
MSTEPVDQQDSDPPVDDESTAENEVVAHSVPESTPDPDDMSWCIGCSMGTGM